jgi:hypothetical protein
MSLEAAGPPAALPAGAAAGEPAWVRSGSPALQRDYALGVEFEKMLTQQLAGALTASAGVNEEGAAEEGVAGGSSVLSSMLPGALSEGVSAGGGLGLAAELARDMQSREGKAASSAPESSPPGAAPAVLPAGGTPAQSAGGGSP